MDLLNFLAPSPFADIPLDAPSRPIPDLPVGGVPPGPRLPASALRRFAYGPQGGPGGAAPVFEVNRYPTGVITLNGTVAASGTALVLNSSPTKRIWMTIRNSSASTGILLLAIGQAASIATAVVELIAGGSIVFDYAVPQDEINIGATAAGAVNWTLSYADTPT